MFETYFCINLQTEMTTCITNLFQQSGVLIKLSPNISHETVHASWTECDQGKWPKITIYMIGIFTLFCLFFFNYIYHYCNVNRKWKYDASLLFSCKDLTTHDRLENPVSPEPRFLRHLTSNLLNSVNFVLYKIECDKKKEQPIINKIIFEIF